MAQHVRWFRGKTPPFIVEPDSIINPGQGQGGVPTMGAGWSRNSQLSYEYNEAGESPSVLAWTAAADGAHTLHILVPTLNGISPHCELRVGGLLIDSIISSGNYTYEFQTNIRDKIEFVILDHAVTTKMVLQIVGWN